VREEFIKNQTDRISKLEGKLKNMEKAKPRSESSAPATDPSMKKLEVELRTREEQLRRQEIENRLKMWEEEAKVHENQEKRRRELAQAEERLRRMEEELKKVASSQAQSEAVSTLQALLADKEKEISGLRTELKDLSSQARTLSMGELPGPLKSYTFTNFVIGSSNKFPFEVCQAVAQSPSDAYNPLFIYSSVGLGKTHLMCSIGNTLLDNKPDAKVAYVTSEEFTNDLLKAVETNQLETFRDRYRSIDMLLIDDIQFLAGKESTQEEFFNTFNALYNKHKQIVITSDRPPREIETLEDRLRSRFEGGLIVDIKKPELSTRSAILRRALKRKGIDLPDDVVFFLANKVKSNNRTLLGALNKLCAQAQHDKVEITIAMASDVLRDLDIELR